MRGGMKGLLTAVLLVVIGLVMAPIVFDAVHDAVCDKTSETFAVTTATGETTASVVLTNDHYHTDSVTHITVTSDNAADSPTAQSYTSATRTLVVGGLVEAATRNLTVQYEVAALTNYPGTEAVATLIPMLYVVGIFLLAGGMVWRSFA